MDENVETLLAQLDGQQRGFLLAALLFDEQAPTALEHLHGESKPSCVSAIDAAMALSRAARLDLTQHLTQQLLYGLTDGLDRVHPSWVAHLLADQPSPVSASVLRVLPAAHRRALPALAAEPASLPVQVALPLAQHVLAPLAPMIAPRDQPDAEGRDLLHLGAEPLERALAAAAQLVLIQLARQAGSQLEVRLRQRLPGLFDAAAEHWAERAPRLPSEVLAGLAPAWKNCSFELLKYPSRTGGGQQPVPQWTQGALLALGTATSALALSRRVALSLAQQLPHDLGLKIVSSPGFGPHQELLDLLRLAANWTVEASC